MYTLAVENGSRSRVVQRTTFVWPFCSWRDKNAAIQFSLVCRPCTLFLSLHTRGQHPSEPSTRTQTLIYAHKYVKDGQDEKQNCAAESEHRRGLALRAMDFVSVLTLVHFFHLKTRNRAFFYSPEPSRQKHTYVRPASRREGK